MPHQIHPHPTRTPATPATTLGWREITQAALDGIYPSDTRLEAMLDRIEALP